MKTKYGMIFARKWGRGPVGNFCVMDTDKIYEGEKVLEMVENIGAEKLNLLNATDPYS